MVLEALAAVSLASAVLQFVQFTTKVASKGHEYQKSVDGVIKEHIELNEYAENFSRLSKRLKNATKSLPRRRCLSEEEKSLLAMADNCQMTCREITDILDRLQKPPTKTKFASLRLALKAVWSEEKIESSLQKLRLAREDLVVNLLVVMNNQQSEVDDLIRRENQRVEKMETDLLKAIEDSRQQLSGKITELSKELSQTATEKKGSLLALWRTEIDISDVEGVFLKASEADDRNRASELLRDSLYYEQMEDRHETIPIAHTSTFQWIFDQQSAESVPWKNFVSWLSGPDQPDSLYWITGKPGSGKSTLMRYLSDEHRTRLYLKRWAKSSQLIVASCFFWHSGEPIQKSQVGLLRSLLHQLFSQAPQLMESICSWRWRSYMSGALRLGPWTNQQLLQTLKLALMDLSANLKVCIFIDGLDEFEGDNAARSDLVEFVRSLSRIPNVKACVSSRPWSVFKNAFEAGPSLRLHDLSRQDIKSYIDEELVNTEFFTELTTKDRIVSSQLAFEIVEKANGVFLWVFLVVRDLLECLRNGDGIGDLWRKVNSMPSDLDAFFTNTINRLDNFYFEQAYNLFQIAMTADHPLSLLTYSYVLEEDEFDPVSMGIEFMGDFQIFDKCKIIDRRLNSRCRGLLEVTNPPREYVDFSKRVDFLHRTVRDFFESGALDDMLQEVKVRTRYTASFDANKALAGSFLAQMKTVDFDPRDLRRCKYVVDEIFKCARRYEKNNDETLVDILDNLDDIGTELFVPDSNLKSGEHWTSLMDGLTAGNVVTEDGDGDTFLSTAVRHNLRKYLRIKLSQCPSAIHEKSGRPLLDYVLRPNGIARDGPLELDVQTLELLLRTGSDPNKSWHNSTVWGYWLEYLAKYHERAEPVPRDLLQPTRVLVAYGAQEKVILPSNEDLQSASQIIRSVFGKRIAKEFENKYKQSKGGNLWKRLTQFSNWRNDFESNENYVMSIRRRLTN